MCECEIDYETFGIQKNHSYGAQMERNTQRTFIKREKTLIADEWIFFFKLFFFLIRSFAGIELWK